MVQSLEKETGLGRRDPAKLHARFYIDELFEELLPLSPTTARAQSLADRGILQRRIEQVVKVWPIEDDEQPTLIRKFIYYQAQEAQDEESIRILLAHTVSPGQLVSVLQEFKPPDGQAGFGNRLLPVERLAEAVYQRVSYEYNNNNSKALAEATSCLTPDNLDPFLQLDPLKYSKINGHLASAAILARQDTALDNLSDLMVYWGLISGNDAAASPATCEIARRIDENVAGTADFLLERIRELPIDTPHAPIWQALSSLTQSIRNKPFLAQLTETLVKKTRSNGAILGPDYDPMCMGEFVGLLKALSNK